MAILLGAAELRRQTRFCANSAARSADGLARDVEECQDRSARAGEGLREQRLSEAVSHLRAARAILDEIADECTERTDQS